MIQFQKKTKTRKPTNWWCSAKRNVTAIPDMTSLTTSGQELSNFKKMPTNWWGRQNAAPQNSIQIIGGSIFGHFSNFDKCRLEAAGDVISGVAVDSVGMYVGIDVRATFGESGSNSGRIIRLIGRPNSFYASLLCSI